MSATSPPVGKIVLAALACALLAPVPVAAAPGDLDPSFGSHGIARIGFGDPAASGAMALQPDGRIVSAGTRFSSDESDFALARLNADGSLDPSFAGDGLKTTGFAVAGNAQPADSAADVALGSDGRILVAGSSAEAFGLARYTPDGELDGSFGDGGLVRTEFPEGLAGAATALIQPDGRILAAGHANGNLAMARYEVDGTLDPSFSGDGTLSTDYGASSFGFRVQGATAMALYGDGRVVVAGKVGSSDPVTFTNTERSVLARYLPNGELDPTFGDQGVVTKRFRERGTFADLSLLGDGRILALGSSGGHFVVNRYFADGGIDRAFNRTAVEVREFRPSGGISGAALAITAAGDLILAGNNARFVLMRLHSDGAIDNSFSHDGRVVTRIRGFGSGVDVALQPDGRILVDGSFSVARYLVSEGPADADADGVRDKRDRCPEVYAGTAHGCPVFKRTKIYDVAFDSGRKGAFAGALAATGGNCHESVHVKLYERRRGRDRFVGRDDTMSGSAAGYFSIKGRLTRGTYYVKVRRQVLHAQVLCRGFTSKKIRVR